MISIVTPHYNGKYYHEAFFDSLLSQSYVFWELVIVDDASTQEDFDSLLEFARVDDRIVVVRNEKNLGVSAARNKGISLARYDYIAFIDIDDLWSYEKLEEQLFFMRVNSADFCAMSFSVKDGNQTETVGYSTPSDINLGSLLRFKVNIACSTVMYRRDRIRFLFCEELSNAEDYHLWARILLESDFKGIYYSRKALVTYRKSRNSLSSNKIKQLKGVFVANHKLFGSLRGTYYTVHYVLNSLYRYGQSFYRNRE